MTRRRRGPFGMSMTQRTVRVRRYMRDENWTIMLHSPHEQGRTRPHDGSWQRGEACMLIGKLCKRETRRERFFVGWTAKSFDNVIAPWNNFRCETLWDVYLYVNRN